jgi:hypothetical protein
VSDSLRGRSYLPPEEPPFQKSGLASASLVMGILSWAGFPLICGLAAVFLGHKARIEIANSEGRLTGDLTARIGLWLGYANVVLVALIGLCAASFFLLLPILERLASP